ncbi:MAG: hypothetical protein R2854_09700 [Caldilineaceae bacterium]
MAGERALPRAVRIAWLATIFLLLSPIHLFYSQEVRMYGLAMVLGMLATGQLWRWRRRPTRGGA